MTRSVVTGGAGFIGSHLVEALAARGDTVVVLDDFSTGDRAFLDGVDDAVDIVDGDAGDAAVLDRTLQDAHTVWHLAANPEVRTGATEPTRHVQANVGVTVAVLEAVRRHRVPRLHFTSTSTVYGRADVRPTPEDYGPLLPISVYGGCKLACEGLVSAYAQTFGFDAFLHRFANVVGPRSNHGVTYDFVHKLRADPLELEVLGDGTQSKSYVSVADTVAGMLHADRHAPPGVHAYNIGSHDAIPVTRVAEVVSQAVGAEPRLRFAGGAADGAGWTGDVKHMMLDTSRLEALGWRPRHASADAVRTAAQWLVAKGPG